MLCRRPGVVLPLVLLATLNAATGDEPPGDPASKFLGTWAMETEYRGEKIAATLTLARNKGKLEGTWQSQGRTMDLSAIEIAGATLRFKRTVGKGALSFEGKLEGDTFSGDATVFRLLCMVAS